MATISVTLLRNDYYSGGVQYDRGDTILVEEYEARRLVDCGDADYADDIGPPEEAPENLPPWPDDEGGGGAAYTDEKAQDAVGAMVNASLVYNDATPSLSRAALTGAVTAAAGSNTTALGSFTKAQLDGAVSDGNVLYVGDITGGEGDYTNEMAQDAVGGMVDATLVYDDATPALSRAALTGAVSAAAGSNTTALGTFTKAQLDGAVSDGNVLYVGDVTQYTTELAQDAVGAMVDSTLAYADATPSLSRAALTGAVTAAAGSNVTALGSFTKSQLDAAVSDGNVLYVGDVSGSPSLSQAVVLRTWPGLTFNDDSPAVATANSTALAAAHQYAYDNNKFVDGEFSDLGYLAINTTGCNIQTDWYGGSGPPPEIRYVGGTDCIRVSQPNVTIKNAHFNRPFVRPQRIVTMQTVSGVTTVTFANPHPYVAGVSQVSPYDLGTEIPNWWTWRVLKTVNTVPDANTITLLTGTADATYDPARTVTITAAVRQGGKLVFTAPNHYFWPGQRITIPSTQHIKTGAVPGVTSPQTLNISTANVDASGFRTYINGVNSAGMFLGMAVWTDTGELPGGAIIDSIISPGASAQVFLSKLAVGTRVGASVIFSQQSMDVQRATITRVQGANTFAVEQTGFDDTAVDANGATATIADNGTDRWACFRGWLDAGATSTKGLVVTGANVRVIDSVFSGAGVIQQGADFQYQNCNLDEQIHTSWQAVSSGVRGRLLNCHSNGPNGDDHFVLSQGFQKFLSQPGEIVISQSSAHNCRHGMGIRAFGGYRLRVENFLAQYCESAMRLEYDNASYFSRTGNTMTVQGFTSRGCGQVVGTQMDTFSVPAVSIYGGFQRLVVDELDIYDSNNGALNIQDGGGDYKFGRVLCDWNRSGPAVAWFSTGNKAIGETTIRDLTIRDSHETGLYLNDRVASNFSVGRLRLEDINRSGTTTDYGIEIESGLIGNVDIWDVDWRNQRYTVGTPWLKFQGTADDHKVRMNSIVLPWQIELPVEFRRLPFGLQVVAVSLAQTLLTTGDKAFTIMPAVRGLSWYPAGLRVTTGNNSTSTVTTMGTAAVHDAAAGGGTAIIANGRTWAALATRGIVDLSKKFLRIGRTTAGSAVVQFGFDTSSLAINAPNRMDEVMPGMVISGLTLDSGNNFPAGTYVSSSLLPDRSLQQVTMSANATTTGAEYFIFSGMVPQSSVSAPYTSALDGTGLTINLNVTVAFAGSNLGAVNLYLIGRMA